jgi:2-oxoglutarate ferredoxin oxidoreductase subunit alpha
VSGVEHAALVADDWALTGATSGTGNARLVSPLGVGQHGAKSSYADHLVECAQATEAMLAGIEPLAETGFCDDAEVVVVAFGTPAKYVRAVVTRLRAEGVRIGYVRPITLLPFPSEILARAAAGARTVAVYENSQGQMVDDVRLALAGAAPVRFIGRLSLDSSGFGIAPDLDGDYLRDRLLTLVDEEVPHG